MKYLPLVYKKLPATAIAIYPFIIFQNPRAKSNTTIIRHELIHFRQQLELLILPFYVIYLLNYSLNLARYRDHDKAYRNILFEREAYVNDNNPDYLSRRQWFAWLRAGN